MNMYCNPRTISSALLLVILVHVSHGQEHFLPVLMELTGKSVGALCFVEVFWTTFHQGTAFLQTVYTIFRYVFSG